MLPQTEDAPDPGTGRLGGCWGVEAGQYGGGGTQRELGRGKGHRTPWGAWTSFRGRREGKEPFQLCSEAAAPDSPHPRLQAGPRALTVRLDVHSPPPAHFPPLSVSHFEAINISHHCHAKSKYIIR